MTNFQLPSMRPAVKAAMKEDISSYRTDFTTGDTNMDFEAWLRSQRPMRYQLYIDLSRKKEKGSN